MREAVILEGAPHGMLWVHADQVNQVVGAAKVESGSGGSLVDVMQAAKESPRDLCR